KPQRTSIIIRRRACASRDDLTNRIVIGGGENRWPIRTGAAVKGAIDKEGSSVGTVVPFDAFGDGAAFHYRGAEERGVIACVARRIAFERKICLRVVDENV